MTAPIAAKATDEVYRLSAPLMLDPAPSYENPEGYEAPIRKGMVLHGYRYDALNGLDWDSIELAQAAAACGDRLKLPASALRPNNPDQTVTHNFWLIYSPPEALYISQIVTLTGLENCVASTKPRISLARLIFAGDKVTEVRQENGKWLSPNTMPLKGGFGYFGNEFFRPANLTDLRRRPRTSAAKPERPLQIEKSVVCFFGSGGMIYTEECRLDLPGRWQGMLVRKRSFHTATVDQGMEVDYLDTDASIDAGLFEWDRAITLTK